MYISRHIIESLIIASAAYCFITLKMTQSDIKRQAPTQTVPSLIVLINILTNDNKRIFTRKFLTIPYLSFTSLDFTWQREDKHTKIENTAVPSFSWFR